jgi:hypothetical protein
VQDDEGRTETERQREEPDPEEPREGEPWAKTSSGDKENVTDDD